MPHVNQQPPAKVATVTAAHMGLYVMLLAMSTSELVRSTALAIAPEASSDSVGLGFSFVRFLNQDPALQHLGLTHNAAEELASIADPTESDSVQACPSDGDGSDPENYLQADPATDDMFMEIEEEERPATDSFVTSAGSSHASFSEMPVAITANILDFLTLAEINNVRQLATNFVTAADMLAPRPLGTPFVTFVRCNTLSALPKPAPVPHAPPTPFVWRCVNCASYSQYHEQCTYCGVNIRQSGCRVFLGQVRKQHTAASIRRFLSMLCPNVNVLHIESHSNKDGYEKGAAWLYVDTPDEAVEVVNLHKRVLFDCDSQGDEGFWFVESPDLESALCDFAEKRREDVIRKQRPLPGQPLVAEFPATSMLRGYRPQPLYAAVSSHPVEPNGAGWYQ
jgi:hypothetical protein